MALDIPNDILNDTPVDAVPIKANYDEIEQYVNTNAVLRDGSVAMTGQLTLGAGNPIEGPHATPKSYVDTLLPIGVIMDYVGEAAPAGGIWLLCNGATVSKTTYVDLFNIIGFRYGGSGGSFNLPNFAGKVGVGVDSGQTRFDATGKTGGSYLVPVPSHTHDIDHNHAVFDSGGQSATHTHKVDPPLVHTSEAPDHTHPFSYTADAEHVGGDGARITGYVTTGLHSTIGPAGEHDHTVNIAEFDSENNSGGHTHQINMPLSTGLVSGAFSKSVQIDASPVTNSTTEHLPPYVVCNKIIKVL